MKKKSQQKRDPVKEAFTNGTELVRKHPLFAPMMWHVRIDRSANSSYPGQGLAKVTDHGDIFINPEVKLNAEQFSFVIAHCVLHLAFNHFQCSKLDTLLWEIACDLVAYKFLIDMKFGQPYQAVNYLLEELPCDNEDKLYEFLSNQRFHPDLARLGTGDNGKTGMFYSGTRGFVRRSTDWQRLFSQGLQAAVANAVNVAGGVSPGLSDSQVLKTSAERARHWFMSHYPLLGSLASSVKVIENKDICEQYAIKVAAINIELKEIYINPVAGLSNSEIQFVIAHELLHAGLQHDTRRLGRDAFLWNVACDYVINGWLKQMDVGDMPACALYDPALDGLSAESIYDSIVTDLRRLRKIATLAGQGQCDILSPQTPTNGTSTDGRSLDDFYRECLSQGLEYHTQQQRGLLPQGLIEAINALSQPPIQWDVELAKWFDGHFSPLEKRRSYARMSRRQSSAPDIPMPRYVHDEHAEQNRTYAVVLDTSGSMDRNLLAKALGTIVSYSLARDVSRVRLVFCDANAYDQGYVRPEDLAETVKIKGRGGTVLQPAITLLQNADDFPKEGPILIITDGGCDRLTVKRDHAYVMPVGHHLPFYPKGPVFRVS